MNGGSLGYLTKEGFRNVWVNRLMSIASISVLFSCLVMIGCAFLLLVNMNALVGGIEEQNVIMVFVDDNATTMQTKQLGERIEALDNVKKAEFVPKEAALKEQLEQLGGAADLFDGLDKNPLPDAYKVTLRDMDQFDQTVVKLKALDNVLRVRENAELAAKLQAVRSTIGYISIGIIGMLLVVSLFILSNTIKITMFGRRLEISIMKSVGATSWFIRWPFMLEGMILGAVAGVLSLFAVWGIYAATTRSLADILADIGMTDPLPFGRYAAGLLLGFLFVGIVAGTFGSGVSIAKYLKEQECVCIEDTD